MSRIPLSDEKTYLILSEEVGSSFGEIDGSIQRQILSRLLDILESDASPMQFVREQIGNLDIIAAGDQCRLYTKVVPNIPRGQTEYHVIYVFYIDESHDYQQSDLATYHPQAQQVVETLTDYSDVGDVEQYLEQNGALDADDVVDLLSS